MTGFRGLDPPALPESFSATPEPEKSSTLPADNLPLKRMPFRSSERILPLIVLILVEAGVFVILFILIPRIPDKPGSMVMMMESSMKWTGMKPPRWLTRWSAYLKRLPLEQAFIFPDMLFGLLTAAPESEPDCPRTGRIMGGAPS